MMGASLASAREEIGRDHAARSSAGRREAEGGLFDTLTERIMVIVLLHRL
jgi:hypothetical protein